MYPTYPCQGWQEQGRCGDVVIDLVATSYVTAGNIDGPVVTQDTRTLYMKDLTSYGCTSLGENNFTNLIGKDDGGEIKTLLKKETTL